MSNVIYYFKSSSRSSTSSMRSAEAIEVIMAGAHKRPRLRLKGHHTMDISKLLQGGSIPARGWGDAHTLSGMDWVQAPRAKAKMENMIIARQNLDSRQKSADSLEDPGYSWVRGFKPETSPPKPETPAWTPPKLSVPPSPPRLPEMSKSDKRHARAVNAMAARNKLEVGRMGLDRKLYVKSQLRTVCDQSRIGYSPGDARVTTSDHGLPPSAEEWGSGFYRKQVTGNTLYTDNPDADRRRLEAQGITADPEQAGRFAKMRENGWNTPEGKEHCHGVDELEWAVTRGVSGQLRQDHYGSGKGPAQRDDKGRPNTRCFFTAGYNKQLSYLYTPWHGMGDVSATSQYIADKEAKERHDIMTMKHCHDLPDGQAAGNPHAHLPWAKSLEHTAAIPKPRTSPWQLKRAGGSLCGLSGSANAVSSWSKESRTPHAIHQVPEKTLVHHLKERHAAFYSFIFEIIMYTIIALLEKAHNNHCWKEYTDGNISRTCEAARADGLEVGLIMKGQHEGMLGVCSLDAANTVPTSLNPAENFCGSQSLSTVVASRGGARSTS